MKKAPLLTALFTLLFVLTACGSGSGNAATNGSASGDPAANGNSFRNNADRNTPLTPEAKLALGTIKLEGTKQAIDPKLASSLLPLWQLLSQLNSSTSTAPQEVTAVMDQIHTTMTPDQLKTINGMSLTQADIFTAFQQDQANNGSGGTSGSGTTRVGGGNRGNGGFVFAGGGPGGPGGGFGGGGFGGGNRNNGGASTSTQATALTAEQAAQARQNAISGILINQVIRLLETKLRS